MKRAHISPLRQQSWCLALVLTLLFAQFSGLRHRIDHTRWQTPASQLQGMPAASAAATGGYTDSSHSCIALDAAALADTLAGSLLLFIAPMVHASRALPLPCLRRDASFTALFRSRAPPASL